MKPKRYWAIQRRRGQLWPEGAAPVLYRKKPRTIYDFEKAVRVEVIEAVEPGSVQNWNSR